MNRNHQCCACDDEAIMICHHPDCDLPPYLCGGPCKSSLSQKIHTHNKVKNIISIQDFINAVNKIKEPNGRHNQYLDQMRKRVKNLQNTLIAQLEEILDQHHSDFLKKLSLEPTDKILELIQKISQDSKGESFTGKQINILLKGKNVFKKETMIFKAEAAIKIDFEQLMHKLQETKLSSGWMSFSQKIRKSKDLLQQGEKLQKDNKLDRALKKFNQARNMNEFDHLIYFKLGWCYEKLKNYVQAQKNYKVSKQLNPFDANSLNNIGITYFERNLNKEAIRWYSKAIEADAKYVLGYSNRGFSFVMLNMLQQALNDFTIAQQLSPSYQHLQAIKIVSQLIQDKSKN